VKVFITGVSGQLGHDVMNELAMRNEKGTNTFECIGSDLAAEYSGAPYIALDITDGAAVESVLTEVAPDVVIHCAAWTAVDLAEEEDKKEKVRMVNAVGTENLVKSVKKLDQTQPNGCKLMYISSDYVFDGQGATPWHPDCKDYAPLNVYGETKLAGELVVSENLVKYYIVRITWVFGQNGGNFIKTMLNAGKTHDKLTVVCDQIGTPTYTLDLAVLLCDMIATDKYGYYHATNSEVAPVNGEAADGFSKDGCKLGYISWYDFTKEIFRLAVELGHSEYAEDKITVTPVTTAEYGNSKAARPFNSRLDKSKLKENGFTPLPLQLKKMLVESKDSA